ncbi:MAG: hypothetical protein ACREQX_08085 [Candidatus Binataceae bacterium]
MSSSKKQPPMGPEARARAESPNAPPIWPDSGLVPAGTRKLTALLRSSGRYIAPERVEGESIRQRSESSSEASTRVRELRQDSKERNSD